MDESARPSRKGNLTGSARKLKDDAADWHNFMLKWERLNDEGFTYSSKIANIVLGKQPVKEASLVAGDEMEHSVASTVEVDTLKSNEELEKECSRLQETVEKMAHIVSKMERIVSTEKGLCDLENFQFGSKGRDGPLFLTWSTAEFASLSSQLHACYQQELALKQLILRELAHTTDPQLSMVYLSAWLHQPYLDDLIKLRLQALLLETGHKAP